MAYDDEHWMRQAIILAQQAEALGEVPVGALVVLDDQVIGEGFNQVISACDPTAHAEVLALRAAATKIQNYRLNNACLYITLEPCAMCAGAMIHSRITKVVYGASEPKAGVAKSQTCFFEESFLNHKVDVVGGVCEQECSAMISAFFTKRRAQKREEK